MKTAELVKEYSEEMVKRWTDEIGDRLTYVRGVPHLIDWVADDEWHE